MKKVDFKEIAVAVRFNLLSSINLPTPCEFESLSEIEQHALYRSLFGLHHDICDFLSSAIDTDKIMSRYDID